MKRTELKRSSALPRNRKPLPKTRKTTAAQLRKKATTLWGQVIHARDDCCQVCGRSDGKLDAHHIVPRERNATRTDENNGMLVCAYPCHNTVLHGDPFKAVCIYSERLGVDGYAALRDKAYNGIHQRFPKSFWESEVSRLTALLKEQ